VGREKKTPRSKKKVGSKEKKYITSRECKVRKSK